MHEISAEIEPRGLARPTPVGPADLERCSAILAAGSRSFALASTALPPALRSSAAAVYAFCRVADDAVDEDPEPRASLALLRARLDRIYRSAPIDDAVDRAFTAVVEQFEIPRAVPEALLEGFAWDAEDRRYATIEDTIGYGVRVASTVGVMMCLVLGRRERRTLARAAELGIAMQLTNIARDVGEDARRGRLYLPEAWLHDEGLDAHALVGRPEHSPAVGRVVAKLLATAAPLYGRADLGIRELPRRVRIAIRAARLIYADIGRVVAARGHDSVSGRAVVSAPRKLQLLLASTPAWFWRPSADAPEELPAVRFLLDAALADPARAPQAEATCP